MTETKTVVVLNGEIINVGVMENMPDGATIEDRIMTYTIENGWRELGWVKEPTFEEKVLADLDYISIMTGVEL